MRTRFISLPALERRELLLAFAGVVGLPLAGGCSLPTSGFSFRLTVNIATEQGLCSGWSVMQITTRREPIKIGDSATLATSFAAEAVAIALPSGLLFATLARDSGTQSFPVAVVESFEGDVTGTDDFLAKVRTLDSWGQVGRRAIMPRRHYPALRRFANISDPSSIQVVDPDNLAADFGRGVDLRDIVLEIVSENPTNKIDQRLPWLKRLNGHSFKPGHKMDDWSLAATTNTLSFSRGKR